MAGTAVVLGGAPALHRSRGVVRVEVAITCDASGVLTATEIGDIWGRIVGVCYNGGLDASAVITLTDGKTGGTILAYTTGTEGTPTFFRPSVVVVGNDGATLGAASANYPNTNRDIKVAGKVKLGVASGGTSETGTIAFIVDESLPGLGIKAVNV